jgi:hypothetical protein
MSPYNLDPRRRRKRAEHAAAAMRTARYNRRQHALRLKGEKE